MSLLTRQRLQSALHLIAASPLLASAILPLHAQTGSVRPTEPVTLNFNAADIEAVARTMATITGRNVVVDPRVKGQLTLVTERAVPPAAAFDQFLAALRLQGFTVVEAAGLYKVVPEADAKLQAGTVAVTQGPSGQAPRGGQVVTQIFQLNFENAANLVPVLRPLISPNNTINVNPGNNSLVITDYADNLQRLARIIAAMDVSNASDVEVIPLQHAIAADLVPLLARLIEGGMGSAGVSAAPAATPGQSDSSFKTTLLAEPRSNAVIVRAANPARVALVRSLVARLDQPAAPGSSAASGNIHVVYLKNADATKLATTLRAALGSAAGASGGEAAGHAGSSSRSGLGNLGGNGSGLGQQNSALGSGSSGSALGSAAGALGASGAGGAGKSNQPSTGGIIQADPSTNSLIISAPEPLYRQIRAVIDKLDGRRAQVLVESLIVEVRASKVAEFGIQWQGVLGHMGGTLGLLGTNSGVAGSNILDLALAAANASKGNLSALASAKPAAGMNFAVAPRIDGKYYLGALATFLEGSGDANVLSTPNLMTLDNEEAQIVIGDNVPFPTGSYANASGIGGSVNPFTTVERKDVGLMLRVRPTINEHGTVKMTLYQEVSKVAANTLNNTNGPTTSKRSIESTVLVDDGSVIVIGGLLEDSYGLAQDKVPLAGDLPVLGNLFRSEKRNRDKTNLMVFLRPVVIRDSATSDALMVDRYEAIRALQHDSQPAPSSLLRGVPDAPVLPPLPQAAGKAGPGNSVPAPLAPVSPATPPAMAPVAPVAPQ
ncbi:type II secretion system secretin GspD [Melaminivora sp.]